MGRAGWEKLLRSQALGCYPDPYGDGGTCAPRSLARHAAAGPGLVAV